MVDDRSIPGTRTAGGGTAPVTASHTGPDWSALRRHLEGDVVLPGDSEYPQAKLVEIAEYDAVDPAAIAYCETAGDVRTTIAFAQEHDVPVRVRSGGHNFAGWSIGEGVIIDVSRFRHVQLTGDTVHVGPGIQAVDALAAFTQLGKQVVTGTCPTVCPGGFLSGGGVGFQTRTFGIGSDRVVSVQAALADGRVVHASAAEEPNLFWALRGSGGGNFGVVLDFEVRPIEAPRMVYFNLSWSWDDVPAFLTAWQEWYVNGPRALNAQVIGALPDAAPGAVPFVFMHGGFFGPPAELEAAFADLFGRAGVRPATSQVLDLPYDQAIMHVYGCSEKTVAQSHRVGTNPEATIARPAWQRLRTRLMSEPLDPAAVTDVLAAYDADRRAGQTRFLSFTGIGGAANDPATDDSAYVHRTTQFQVGYGVVLADPAPSDEEVQAANAWTDKGFTVIDPLSNGGAYINFPDQSLVDWQHSYYGRNYPRLLQIKRQYDPHHFFQHPRSIGS